MEILRPRGTRDFLFDEMEQRKYAENTLRRVFETYGYGEIKTPLFEDLTLFTMKSGEEIKEQIYHFKDKSERELALRPELTAPVARLYMDQFQKSPKPIKMYYFGSCFRYERPQAGRWRQFWQFGCELIGGKSPEAEAEVITMANQSLEDLGLDNFEIHIGNLGILRGVLEEANITDEKQDQVMGIIDKGDMEELQSYLDDLNLPEKYREILLTLIGMEGGKNLLSHVKMLIKDIDASFEALNDLEELLKTLDDFGMDNYVVNLGIARGLDYYSGMVFEIYVHGLGAQKQICGGGTYNLIEVFGGEQVESTGFAFGFDRVMGALESQKINLKIKNNLKVYVAPISEKTRGKAFEVVQNLRSAGIAADVDLARKKLKKILNYANNLGVNYVVLIGERDLKEGRVTLKDMRTGTQEMIEIDSIQENLKKLIYV
ncbi:MAG: histidine--tRNA ligase [Methanobacterium sp. BRmetb2]|jgi:histidyl-tRNA synthetase|nr:MAG: histidine--tRNA ligase [Methanobacterium sp. BRmetb2]